MDTYLTQAIGPYTVSDDPGRLDLHAMHAYLRRAYWSEQIPFEVIERAVRGSLCIGAYDAAGGQVGLARFISDYATFCYVCDVYVLEEHRGQGLSKALMAMAMDHPKLQGLRRWNLVTKDAHGLYRQFGFTPAAHSGRYMERLDTAVYKRAAAKRQR
ncbi:MAG: acetyltransferase [Gammaproteobacteria bacterium]|jgi:GNAT superfamily N-acetyltransferase|nr:acetyltransferase [Gammaproteobacteria bacterium]